MNRKEIDNWEWTLVMGILNTLVGIMLLTNLGISVLSLSLCIGFSILFRSFWAIGTSMHLKNLCIKLGKPNDNRSFRIDFFNILIWYPALAGITLVF